MAERPLSGVPPERPENGVGLRRAIALVTVLVTWSGGMWLFYLATDGVLDWLAVNTNLVVENAEKLATATGVGKEAETVIDSLNTGSLLQRLVALVELIAKPLFMRFGLLALSSF